MRFDNNLLQVTDKLTTDSLKRLGAWLRGQVPVGTNKLLHDNCHDFHKKFVDLLEIDVSAHRYRIPGWLDKNETPKPMQLPTPQYILTVPENIYHFCFADTDKFDHDRKKGSAVLGCEHFRDHGFVGPCCLYSCEFIGYNYVSYHNRRYPIYFLQDDENNKIKVVKAFDVYLYSIYQIL